MLLKTINDSRTVTTSNLSAKRDFAALKAEVGKLDISKFVNFPPNSNNLKK